MVGKPGIDEVNMKSFFNWHASSIARVTLEDLLLMYFYRFRFDMADKIDLAEGCDSFRLANPPPWTACLNYASLKVSSNR